MDNMVYLIIGVLIGFMLCLLLYYSWYVAEKRKEYTNKLNDKEYRKYMEFRGNL